MVGPSIKRLLSASSPPLLNADVGVDLCSLSEAAGFASSLASVLELRNGFFAFEGALRFFPSASVPISYGLSEWNDANLWRTEYGDLAQGCFFFAEDIFGGQFCVNDTAVMAFDPETGDRAFVADSLDGWAQAVLSNYEALTGCRVAHEWQTRYRKLRGRERLVPKIPFIAGGEYAASNLVAMDAAKGMRARGNLALQVRDLPDGTQIRFQITD